MEGWSLTRLCRLSSWPCPPVTLLLVDIQLHRARLTKCNPAATLSRTISNNLKKLSCTFLQIHRLKTASGCFRPRDAKRKVIRRANEQFSAFSTHVHKQSFPPSRQSAAIWSTNHHRNRVKFLSYTAMLFIHYNIYP